MANKKKKGEIRIGREIGGEKDRAGERKKEERRRKRIKKKQAKVRTLKN